MTAPATEALIRINIEDILEALGLERVRRGRWLVERLCLPAARRFARKVADYDRLVEARGLCPAARFLLEQNVRGLEVAGVENIPDEGPLLLVSNHPGLADAMAIFSCLRRGDLMTVAADRPFLRALRNMSKYLIYLRPEVEDQSFVLRRVAGHLRRGGATLIFPGGRIEPDPDVLPGAIDALKEWSKSTGLIVRLVRNVRVVPVIVRGVVSRKAINHPLTRLRRLEKDRERLGAVLQIILPSLRSVEVKIAFGEALRGEALISSSRDAREITDRIVEAAGRLIESPPLDWLPLARLGDVPAADSRADDGDLVACGNDFEGAPL
jgi:1-acyl-sn-glycerol-3-phosphate acyltransferase